MRRARTSSSSWSGNNPGITLFPQAKGAVPRLFATVQEQPERRQHGLRLVYLSYLAFCFLTAGCAALSNPALEGIPVRLLPEELRGKSVEGAKTIPLNLLAQPQPDAYRVGPNDVLGIWVEGVLGQKDQPPPLLAPVRLDLSELPQATGYPTQVRLDGTISLPLIKPLRVQGMTLSEVENEIRRVYSETGILKEKGPMRISVSLSRPRTYHILVLREDSSMPSSQGSAVNISGGFGSTEYISPSRKGSGWALDLPAYTNDVMSAIAKTGGLPGSDALDEVIVQRNARRGGSWEAIIQDFNANGVPYPMPGTSIYRIPLRVRPGNLCPFRPEDIVLQDGDVLYIPARDDRRFFTAGLIPPGEHLLPRDTDLDVLEALARVRAPLVNGLFASNNFSGAGIMPGIGQPSATLVTVIRKLPHGGQIPIRVDVAKAIRNPRERILIQPGDILVMQETPEQGIVRYATQIFDFVYFWKPVQTPWGFGTTTVSAPGGVAPVTISPAFTGVTAPTPGAGNLPGIVSSTGSSGFSAIPISTSGSATTGSVAVGR
ncbi:MAG: polysaccharide biosynthesis/export family protein [Gemmataceae bacterium]